MCEANEAHQHLLSHLHVLTTQQAHRERLHADELEQLRQRIEELAGEFRRARRRARVPPAMRPPCGSRARRSAQSRADAHRSALAELSMELADAQRRQADILEQVVERVSALDRTPPSPCPPAGMIARMEEAARRDATLRILPWIVVPAAGAMWAARATSHVLLLRQVVDDRPGGCTAGRPGDLPRSFNGHLWMFQTWSCTASMLKPSGSMTTSSSPPSSSCRWSCCTGQSPHWAHHGRGDVISTPARGRCPVSARTAATSSSVQASTHCRSAACRGRPARLPNPRRPPPEHDRSAASSRPHNVAAVGI